MSDAVLNRPSKWRAYYELMRVHRPIGTLLLLWPALWALFLAARGMPPLKELLVFLAGTFLMRSAGCVINDYADRDFDGHVQRTKNRPIPMGWVKPKEALGLFAVLCLLAFALVLTLNAYTIVLSLVGAALAALYPFMKRYTHWPQVVLGAAFAWAVPMAYAAVAGSVNATAWLLYAATVLWAVAYDTLYAMVDRDDDLRIGVKSTAILFGRHDLLAVGLCHGAVLGLLALAGWREQLGWPYFAGLLVAAGLAARQLWQSRRRERDACFAAFLANNRFGLAIFLGLAAHFLVL
ncbi:MAG: 4-hydroxybenzoate octaprenyltransferase [Gammaproteobacteria bacterium]|nr:4-hydroxybenzoate octaprenyltransferase [Gammaproteobacteria bacterium]